MATLVFSVKVETVVSMAVDDASEATMGEDKLKAVLAGLIADQITVSPSDYIEDVRLIEVRTGPSEV